MSIHIGLVPLSQNSTDVFTIYSSKSNVMRIQSPSNNVFVDIGDYNLGQRSSNEPFVFSYKNNNIITFNSNEISLNRNIIATSNLNILGSLNISSDINTPLGMSCSNLNTSSVFIQNNLSNGYKIIECRSNNIDTLYVKNEDNGVGYIGGRIGIGTAPLDKKYSLITSSNIFVNGDIIGTKVITDRIISTNNISQIIFNENSIKISSAQVTVDNLVLGGKNSFSNLICNELADISGLLLASNVSIFNNNLLNNPFKINQRLINFEYGNNIFGNPISVKSQHKNIATDPTIMELSSCGNLILGDYPALNNISGVNIINDYVIRGNIPTNREKHFKGYLSFSSNGSEKTTFNVNKSGQLSIGTYQQKALLDIENSFTGNEIEYVKPVSIIYLRNNSTSNELPFIKCENSNSKHFQITSNATLCFNETPIDMYKYNIESENNYLSNIDTCKISSYYPDGIIDMSYSTLSNINSTFSCNIETGSLSTSNLYSQIINADNCFITNLKVGSFSTIGSGNESDLSVFSIGSDHLCVSGKNTVISYRSTDLLTYPPSYVNKDTDKLIIETDTSTTTANGYTIFGNNKLIKLFCKNENTEQNSYVVQELNNSTGGFAFVSRLRTVGSPPELYITSINSTDDPYGNPALTLYNDKKVLFSYNLLVQIDSATVASSSFVEKSVNIGDGLLVYSSILDDLGSKYVCLTTNKYGSLDIGRGISSTPGPFNKQGGWTNVNSSGIYIILNADYGVRENTSGTLYIQVKGGTTKLGNVAVSFLRFTHAPELFIISNHSSELLTNLVITSVPTGIKVETDTDCKVCWTSIGSR